jgi:UDP-N-acetylenolpyruvoylglucosamine reductase
MERIAVSSFFSEGVLRKAPLFAVYHANEFHSVDFADLKIREVKKSTKGELRVILAPAEKFFQGSYGTCLCNAFSYASEVIFVFPDCKEKSSIIEEELCRLYASCREEQLKGLTGKLRFLIARNISEAVKHCFLESSYEDALLVFSRGKTSLQTNFSTDFISRKCDMAKELKSFSFFKTGGRSFSGGKTFVVGSGSNLWISDLSTDIEFIKSKGYPSVLGSSLHIPWMVGIPGTLGGWVKMNAGAFGHSISEVVKRVKVDGCWLNKNECGFSYRTSSIKGVIEDIEFDESKIKFLQGEKRIQDYLSRRKKFPARTCGSVFKNPEGEFSAGSLLEKAGAKTMSCGGASVWHEHANVVIAGEGANSSDIYVLISMMRQTVKKRFNITLKPEIQFAAEQNSL